MQIGSNNTQVWQTKTVGNAHQRFGLRKLSVGVASVLLGTTFFLGGQTAVHADTMTDHGENGNQSPVVGQQTAVKTAYQASANNQQVTSDYVQTSSNSVSVQAAQSQVVKEQQPAQQNVTSQVTDANQTEWLHAYTIFAAGASSNRSNTELNDQNSWKATVHYQYGDQPTDYQKQLGYVPVAGKVGQQLLPDTVIRIGMDSTADQPVIQVNGTDVSYTQTDKGYKMGTSTDPNDYDNMQGHVYRLFDIKFTLPTSAGTNGAYNGSLGTYTLNCSNDTTTGKMVFKTADTAVIDKFFQQKLTTEFKYVDYNDTTKVYQDVKGPDVLSGTDGIDYQYQVPKGTDLLLSSNSLKMNIQDDQVNYSGFWKLDPSSTRANYVFLVPVAKHVQPSAPTEDTFGKITGTVVTEDGKPFDFSSGWWGQDRYNYDIGGNKVVASSKNQLVFNGAPIDGYFNTVNMGLSNIHQALVNHQASSVYDYFVNYWPSHRTAINYQELYIDGNHKKLPDDMIDTSLDTDTPTKYIMSPLFAEYFDGDSFLVSSDQCNEMKSVWTNMDPKQISDETQISQFDFPESAGEFVARTGATKGLLKIKGIRVVQRNAQGVIGVEELNYSDFMNKYTYEYLDALLSQGINVEADLVVTPKPLSVQRKNYTVHFKYADGPKAGQAFHSDWHGYLDVIYCDGQIVGYSMDGTTTGYGDIKPVGSLPSGSYGVPSIGFSNPKSFLKSNDLSLLQYDIGDTTVGSGGQVVKTKQGFVDFNKTKLDSSLAANYILKAQDLRLPEDAQIFKNPRHNWNVITRDLYNNYFVHHADVNDQNTWDDYSFFTRGEELVADSSPVDFTVNAHYNNPVIKTTLYYVDSTNNDKVVGSLNLNLVKGEQTIINFPIPDGYRLKDTSNPQNNVMSASLNLTFDKNGNVIGVKTAGDYVTSGFASIDVVPAPKSIHKTTTNTYTINFKYADASSPKPDKEQLGHIDPSVAGKQAYNPIVYTQKMDYDVTYDPSTNQTTFSNFKAVGSSTNSATGIPTLVLTDYHGHQVPQFIVASYVSKDQDINFHRYVLASTSDGAYDFYKYAGSNIQLAIGANDIISATGSLDDGTYKMILSGHYIGFNPTTGENTIYLFERPYRIFLQPVDENGQKIGNVISKIIYPQDSVATNVDLNGLNPDSSKYSLVHLGAETQPSFKVDDNGVVHMTNNANLVQNSSISSPEPGEYGVGFNVLFEPHYDVVHESRFVTRHIVLHEPDGTIHTANQQVEFARDGKKYTASGKIVWGDYSTGKFDAFDVPAVIGYTPSKIQVPEQSVTGTAPDTTVDVYYTADKQSLNVHFVDVNGQLIAAKTINGATDGTQSIASLIPEGWMEYGNEPNKIKFGANNQPELDVIIEHQLKLIDADHPVVAGGTIDGLATLKYPSGLTTSDLTRTIIEKIVQKDGQVVETLATRQHTFKRNTLLDVVTGHITYGNWSNNGQYNFAPYMPKPNALAEIAVYGNDNRLIVDQHYIPQIKVAVPKQDETITETIEYVPAPKTYEVIFKLPSGQVIDDVEQADIKGYLTVNGNQVEFKAPQGYRLLSNRHAVNYAGNQQEHNIKYVVLVEMAKQSYRPGDQLPDNLSHIPLIKTATRTINITMPNGKVRTIKQQVTFERGITYNPVDSSVTDDGWRALSRPEWHQFYFPKHKGYHLVITNQSGVAMNNIPKVGSINENSGNQIIDVKYIKD